MKNSPLRSLPSRHHQKESLKRWLALACIYAAWNLNGYLAKRLYGVNAEWVDYSYWLFERLFVVASFWAILGSVEIQYRWVIKTLICVGIWKFLYLLAVVTTVIKANDLASLMGLIFTITLSIIVLKWEKRSGS